MSAGEDRRGLSKHRSQGPPPDGARHHPADFNVPPPGYPPQAMPMPGYPYPYPYPGFYPGYFPGMAYPPGYPPPPPLPYAPPPPYQPQAPCKAENDSHKQDVDRFISGLARKSHKDSRSRSRSRSRSPGRRRQSHDRRRSPRRSRSSLSPARRPSRRSFDRESDEAKEKRVRAHLKLTPVELIEREREIWTRSAPADLYYQRDLQNPLILRGTKKLEKLLSRFQTELLDRSSKARSKHPPYKPFKLPRHEVVKCRVGRGCCGGPVDGDSSSSDSEDEKTKKARNSKNETLEFMKNRQQQSYRLHDDLWDNQPGELNDGPACRCSIKARKFGIRHGIYQGEDSRPKVDLDPLTNNGHKLHHYR